MAGRGCTIQIKVIGQSGVNEISLPVALHSPLEVLKEQLQTLTNIPMADQVIILCNLSDPERNSDVLLNGRDHLSLRDCGIRNGSYLTLHPLGMTAEKRLAQTTGGEEDNSKAAQQQLGAKYTLQTPISAAQADHSYNGVVFDVVAKGPFEVSITSIAVGGMLGHVVSN